MHNLATMSHPQKMAADYHTSHRVVIEWHGIKPSSVYMVGDWDHMRHSLGIFEMF
ncbi:unnamed protein product [Acanthoscelides obtectus]|uniref:Uncharacterized protein n=1 Tax=Acanthoscelides obtectus TaxID=200917 RepID=A0A9P0PVP5_ACAOB|nr:unnamed protein product [Acanthoscelides obtectus]CAK1651373.1 hypothetical protein AOBTE_LOCUS17231 [Acanthoscelides obtectus]